MKTLISANVSKNRIQNNSLYFFTGKIFILFVQEVKIQLQASQR